MVMGGSPTSPIRLIARHKAILDSHTKNLQECAQIGALLPPALPGTNIGMATVADRLYTIPLLIARKLTIDRIVAEITVLDAGNVARLGIYRSNDNLYPTELVIDGGEVSVAAVAVVTVTVNQQLEKGLYWMAVLSNGIATFRAISPNWSPMGRDPAALSSEYVGYAAVQAYGALPDPFPAGANLSTSNGILVLPRLLSLDN